MELEHIICIHMKYLRQSNMMMFYDVAFTRLNNLKYLPVLLGFHPPRSPQLIWAQVAWCK